MIKPKAKKLKDIEEEEAKNKTKEMWEQHVEENEEIVDTEMRYT